MVDEKQSYRSLSSILGSMRLPAAVKETFRNHEIWAKWVEIVGEDLAKVTSPQELRGKILKISVAHQAWAQQLHFLKPSVMNKIRSICPKAEIQDLKFRVGEIYPQTKKTKIEKIPIKAELSERQKMTLRAVEDPKLRESLKKAMEAAEAARL